VLLVSVRLADEASRQACGGRKSRFGTEIRVSAPYTYFFFSLNRALVVSLACTLLALFTVGAAKGRVTRLSLRRSGVQVMIVGSVSAGVGFAIGHLVTALAG